MANPFKYVPKPYRFRGGDDSDYEVFIGDAGTWCTRHIYSNKAIQSVQPSSNLIEPMLQLANLGLGLLNLGVGIYNVHQTHKVRNDIAQQNTVIQTSFENVDRVLNAQYRMLEILVTSQDDLRDRLEILRQEMQAGFQGIVKEIKDAEAHRRREEFETRTFMLLKTYERFCHALPELFEEERLIERAEELEAWLQSQLNRTSPGSPERFPIFVVLCFSVRAKADAFQAQGGPYANFAIRELNSLKNRIRDEVYEFCTNQSLYTLGVELPEILGQYILLSRSLGKGIEIISSDTFKNKIIDELSLDKNLPIEFFNLEEAIWDDGLDELRKIFESFNNEFVETSQSSRGVSKHQELADQIANSLSIEQLIQAERQENEAQFNMTSEDKQRGKPLNGKTKIRLNTLSDYEWYVRFSGRDRETFNIHLRPFLTLSEVLSKIGHPTPDTGKLKASDLRSLMRLALPEKQSEFMQKLQAEFGWEQLPEFRRLSIDI